MKRDCYHCNLVQSQFLLTASLCIWRKVDKNVALGLPIYSNHFKKFFTKSKHFKALFETFFFYNDAFEYLINVNSKQTPFVSQFIVKPVQNSFITSCQGSSKLYWKLVVLWFFSRLVFHIFYHLYLVEETCLLKLINNS